MAPARTGRDSNNKKAVIKIDHTNRGSLSHFIPGDLILKIVVIKFMAPNIEDAPAKCRLKMAISTEPPECACTPDRGGYTVHPVPAPCSMKAEFNSNSSAGGKSQKLILFNLGKAISGAPISKGTSQFPNPPIITGITKKKIIIKA